MDKLPKLNDKRSRGVIFFVATFVVFYFCGTAPLVSLEQESSMGGRPVMHTFYEKVREGQDDLLGVWKDEWSRAGFEPRILTLKDAKKHPYFKEMEREVRPMFENGYDAMCFYRWLAMATAGGGWMSDYDCFPTNFPLNDAIYLPNKGNFTSFEAHVPSLMSGTADEWTRIAKALVEAIPRTKGLQSDMHTFSTVREENMSGVHFLPPVYNVLRGFMYASRRKVDCEKMKVGRAIHISHHYTDKSFDEGVFPIKRPGPGPPSRYRSLAVKAFMDDWRHQCRGSIFSDDDGLDLS
jgi:hypothetical protein